MSVRLGLLAILDQGSCYGYQLRTELDRRTGGIGPVNVGQIYNTLDRLEKSGLVDKAGADAESANYYTITEAGRATVRDWFRSASPWDELPAKLALALTLPDTDVAAIIGVQRAVAEASAARSVGDSSMGDASRVVIETAQRESAMAEVRLLDAVDALLARGVGPIPLNTDLPRRGRPRKARDALSGSDAADHSFA